MIQRFQLMVYPDIAPAWRHVDRWPDSEARLRMVELFQRLSRLDPEDVAAHGEGDDGLPFLRFTPEAQARFDAWREALEGRLRSGDEHPVFMSHLAKYRSLMPTLAVLFHLVDSVGRGLGGAVSESAAERAIAWCAYLEPHARRIYEDVTTPGNTGAAVLARKLVAGELASPFAARDVRRKQWAGLSTPELVTAALGRLEDLHWIRSEPVRPPEGGRPTTRYRLNPRVVVGERS